MGQKEQKKTELTYFSYLIQYTQESPFSCPSNYTVTANINKKKLALSKNKYSKIFVFLVTFFTILFVKQNFPKVVTCFQIGETTPRKLICLFSSFLCHHYLTIK